jgi:hypothetical protein
MAADLQSVGLRAYVIGIMDGSGREPEDFPFKRAQGFEVATRQRRPGRPSSYTDARHMSILAQTPSLPN